MLEYLANILNSWWEHVFPLVIKIIVVSLFLEGAICLWRKNRYSWRRALAIFLIIDNGYYLLQRTAAAITTGILETIHLWKS